MAIDTTAIAGIISTIKAGNGFKNVATPSVTKLTDIKIPSVAELANIASTQLMAGAVVPTNEALTEARNSIIASQQQALSFSTHISNLSGVSLLGEPNFVTMAKTAQAAREINGNNTCDTVFQIFGAIQNAAAITANVSKFADLVTNFLENIPGRIDDIESNATALTAALGIQIVSDTEAYANAKLTVLQYSVAANLTALFDDQCVGAVLSTIMSDPLKAEVSKASAAIKSKLATSIGGYSSPALIEFGGGGSGGGSSLIPGSGGIISNYTLFVSNTRKSSADSVYHVVRAWDDVKTYGTTSNYTKFISFLDVISRVWNPSMLFENLTKENLVDRLRFCFKTGWGGWNIKISGVYDITFPTKDGEADGEAIKTNLISTGTWYNGPAIPTKYILLNTFGAAHIPVIMHADSLDRYSLYHLYYSSDFPDSRFMFVGSSSSPVVYGTAGAFYEFKKGEWETHTTSTIPRYPVIDYRGPSGSQSQDASLGLYLYPNYDVTAANAAPNEVEPTYNAGIAIPTHAQAASPWTIYNWAYFEIKAL